MRDRVVHGRLPRRRHRDDQKVGALAGLERPDLLLHPHGARTVDGGHLERRGRRDGARIAGDQLVEERRLAHGPEHVQVVVARGAVGAETDGNARLPHRLHRCDAARQLHVALGIVRDADVPARKDGDIGWRYVHRVRRERAWPPEPERLQERRRGRVVLLV